MLFILSGMLTHCYSTTADQTSLLSEACPDPLSPGKWITLSHELSLQLVQAPIIALLTIVSMLSFNLICVFVYFLSDKAEVALKEELVSSPEHLTGQTHKLEVFNKCYLCEWQEVWFKIPLD